VQTQHHIYTFKGGKRSRKYRIKDVGAIMQSIENDTDFMLFFERSDDLHVSAQGRTDMLNLLTLRFACFNRNITLRIYGVTNLQLNTFHQTNNAKNKLAGIYDLPDDSLRLKDQEIKGEDEYNEELRRKREGDVDQAPFDAKDVMDFGNDDDHHGFNHLDNDH